MSPRRVGILGGMGPEATVLLMQKVIAAVPARDDADHVPLIVDQNPQVPSRIKRLIEGTGEDPGPVLAAMARRLEATGAEALAMPCNTAHHYAPAIRAAVGVPFIDMVALSAGRARELAGPGGVVGILASPAVRRIGLFDAAFGALGLAPRYAADEDAMLAAIRRIKAEGPVTPARVALKAASAALLAEGAQVQMIACTEFSLIPEAVARGATVFDTLDVLVERIVGFSLGADEAAGRRRASH
ncbi:amino acid racemase [Limibaculum sp. FT325]|uniref:aspartate/glutamate racemase family protein n=1 Tax=Thermohalobaculum sediminis TaxID=2939436 RepID=UPI0020C14D05|nr:amino acid racemase [Limibaculum sediminis]MCL5777568.1 amino acid racemase [Limibaculum sediminis]